MGHHKTPQDMPREFRLTLARLELLSHGKCQTYNGSGRAADRDPRPQGEAHPPHLRYRHEYLQADNDDARRDIHKAATDELEAWAKTGGKPAKAVRTQVDIDREMRSYTGWTPKEVARRTGNIVTQGQVMDWRRRRSLDPSTGYERRPEEPPAAQALRLKGQGMTIRQIADYLAVPKSIVGRWLKP